MRPFFFLTAKTLSATWHDASVFLLDNFHCENKQYEDAGKNRTSTLPLMMVCAAVQSTWSIKCNNTQPQLIFQQVIQLSNWSCNLWTLGLLCAKIKLGLLQDQWDDFLNGIIHVWRLFLTGDFSHCAFQSGSRIPAMKKIIHNGNQCSLIPRLSCWADLG